MLNNSIGTNWGVGCWKISRGVSQGYDLHLLLKCIQIVLSMCISFIVILCVLLISIETRLEKRNNDMNIHHSYIYHSSLNSGGICDSDLGINRYLQAHLGNWGKCPSKSTAYISFVPDLMLKKMHFVHKYRCLWTFILYRSMLWIRGLDNGLALNRRQAII